MKQKTDGGRKAGAIDFRWLLTLLVISLIALAVGVALGLWLGS